MYIVYNKNKKWQNVLQGGLAEPGRMRRTRNAVGEKFPRRFKSCILRLRYAKAKFLRQDKYKPFEFEKYLKSGSSKAFCKKHF